MNYPSNKCVINSFCLHSSIADYDHSSFPHKSNDRFCNGEDDLPIQALKGFFRRKHSTDDCHRFLIKVKFALQRYSLHMSWSYFCPDVLTFPVNSDAIKFASDQPTDCTVRRIFQRLSSQSLSYILVLVNCQLIDIALTSALLHASSEFYFQ